VGVTSGAPLASEGAGSYSGTVTHVSAATGGRPDDSRAPADVDSFRRQESTFAVLNLLVLATLLLLHALFASYLGNPSPGLLLLLGAAFLGRAVELVWIQGLRRPLPAAGIVALTAGSVALNLGLAFALSAINDRQDSPYFVLVAMPVIEAAFRFSLRGTLVVVAAATLSSFVWLWHYSERHPPVHASEYFEAGVLSLIYAIVGVLVFALVDQLRQNERRLARNLADLEATRERLLVEEKLGAVGRLSSAIAHEIRNPVAMISSALATANRGTLDTAAREEMFQIAAREATRLETLTTGFLQYARPRLPEKRPSPISDTIAYLADVARARAGEAGVRIDLVAGDPGLLADIDPGQVQQALLNLILNAIDATPAGAAITIRTTAGDRMVRVDVENPGDPVAVEVVDRLFEPFFTTKRSGTGLGLAIARNIALAHGGDLVLSGNEAHLVRFSLTVPLAG
jgi:two-component system sensor histidine kinase HydH